MKKTALVFALMALTLAFTQCKKEQPTTDQGVRITLTAGYGNAKTGFTPNTGAFVWSNGVTEYIYVGGSEHTNCLGVLSGTGTGTGSMTFSGTLTTTPSDKETLHFFYLGKGKDGSAVSTLDLSNQNGTLESVTNYHIAVGDGSYTSGTINYATILEMKMAIAYFDVSGFQNANNTAESVYLHGDEVYTIATVNYQDGTITGATKGYLNMGTATNGKYVALIPSVETATTLKFDSNSKTGMMTFLRGIQEKKYYSNEGATLVVMANTLPEGVAPGLFSVSSAKMVRFSKGNLQYIGSAATPYWKFADNQWDYLGNNGQNSSDINLDRDLFNWGTGTNPYYIAHNYSGYADFNDWGDNPISNGGNISSSWNTLTEDEWVYLFYSRSSQSGIRYAKAIVNGINGIMLLPDDWDENTYHLNSANTASANYGTNTGITESLWENGLESYGAVFLPAAGSRSYTAGVYNVGDVGVYWSSTEWQNDPYYAFYMYFSNEGWGGDRDYKFYGYSVRLVRDID